MSETNATPVDAMGAWDQPLQEAPGHSREVLEQQAPNRKTTWARSQQDRAIAMTGPRFEQTMMEYQVRGLILLFWSSQLHLLLVRREGVAPYVWDMCTNKPT